MLEIEVKYRAPTGIDLNEQLARLDATPGAERDDADAYYNAPHRDFAVTDEAFRVRRIGPSNYVTYKGPRRDPATKTRTEIEVPLADGPETADGFQQILGALGFRPVAIVRKRRRIWQLKRAGFELEICLDDVDRVGRYVEVEIVAPEAELEAARALVLQVAAELGLEDAERRSYLELLLAHG